MRPFAKLLWTLVNLMKLAGGVFIEHFRSNCMHIVELICLILFFDHVKGKKLIHWDISK